MKRTNWPVLASTVLAFAAVSLGQSWLEKTAAAQARRTQSREAPKFQVDASWPKIPNGWVFGWVSSASVDAQDHVWVLQRPGTLSPEEKAKAAPPVLEFDAAGKFIQGWGGPGAGYEIGRAHV